MARRDAQKQRLYDAELLFVSRANTLSKLMINESPVYEHVVQLVQHIQKIALEKFRVKLYNRPIKVYANSVYSERYRKNLDITITDAAGLFIYDHYSNTPDSETVLVFLEDEPYLRKVILHEMAHWINMCMYPSGQEFFEIQPHGEEFAAIYLWVINEILGKDDALTMYFCMKENKVSVDEGLLRINGLSMLLYY
jgi:hypothetical protein